jgi:hypothetical protein
VRIGALIDRQHRAPGGAGRLVITPVWDIVVRQGVLLARHGVDGLLEGDGAGAVGVQQRAVVVGRALAVVVVRPAAGAGDVPPGVAVEAGVVYQVRRVGAAGGRGADHGRAGHGCGGWDGDGGCYVGGCGGG